MVRRILVPLDPSGYTVSAYKHAGQLAQSHDATVTGLAILDLPGIGAGPVSPGAYAYAKRAEQRREQDAHQQLQALMKTCASHLEEMGVEHDTREVSGSPAEQIIEHSAFYDLLVLGLETFFSFETSLMDDKVETHVVGKTIAPVLLVPSEFKAFGESTRVVIAYDGSLSSKRALREFTQVAAFVNPAVKLVISCDSIENAEDIFAPAKAYLSAYGYTNLETAWTPEHIIRAMESDFIPDADLVVAGAHAKKHFFDFGLGSLSKYLMSQTETPVLISV
ncbi:MAG: universal stress protein [Bacteroidota bacterium]